METKYYNPRHVSGLMPMLWVSILFGVGIVLGDLLGRNIGTGMWIVIACLVVFVGLAGVKRWPNVSFGMILMAVVAFGGMRISLNEDGMEYEEDLGEIGSGETEMDETGRYGNARMEDKNEETCEMLVMNEPVVHGKVVHFDGYVYKGSWYVRNGKKRRSGIEGRKVRMALLRDTVTGRYRDVHIGCFIKARAEWAMLEEWHHTTSHFSYVRWQKSRGFTRRAFVGIGKWEMMKGDLSEIGLGEIGLSEIGLGEIGLGEIGPDEERVSEIGLGTAVNVRMMMFRQMIIEKLKASGLDEEAYGVAAAMVLGDKSSLSRDIRDEFNKAGAAHILALSGMHLMILYMMLSALLGRIRRRVEFGILGLMWLYVLFTGMPVSLVRAATMLSIYKVVGMFGINQHRLNVVGFAAFVILVANPQSLWDVGFQMSFMAVLFIVIYAPYFDDMKPDRWKLKKKELKYMTKWKQRRYKVYKKLWNMASVSVAAQLGTLPLSCYYFERIPCYFLISNFIVIPMAAIIIGVMIVLVVGCIVDMYVVGCGAVIALGGKVLEYVVCWLDNSQRFIAWLPGSSIEGVDVNVVQVVLMYIIICGGMALAWKLRHGIAEGTWMHSR